MQLFALAIGIVLVYNYQQQRLDLLFYDQIISHAQQDSKEHTVIVEIDDRSLAMLGEWPWSRDIHADLIKVLTDANAAAIGFDILFSSNSHSTQQQDEVLAAAISQANIVVLPIAPSKSGSAGLVELLPQATLAQNAAMLGHVDYEFDIDGIVRSSFLYAGYQSARWPSFALALSQIADPELNVASRTESSGSGWTRQSQILINFSSSKAGERLTHYSYFDVLTNRVPKAQLQDKVILIGMNGTAMGDQFPTPISYNHQTMPGVEINAHMVNSVLNQNAITTLSTSRFAVTNVVLLIITIAIFLLSRNKPLLPFLLFSAAIPLVTSFVLLVYWQSWFAPSLILGLQIIVYGFVDLSNNKLIASKLKTLSHQIQHDEATGLFNEKGFVEHLFQLQSQTKTTLMAMQVGKYRAMNSLLGPEPSNKLLNTIKSRIEQTLSISDFPFARTSGSEFIIALPTVNTDELKELTELLLNALSEPYPIHDHSYRLPAYIGVSDSAECDSEDKVSALLNNARSAKERAKESVLSSYCLFTQDIKDSYEVRAKLESDLARALQNNELEIHYQPQVESTSSKIVGAEALARWRHPERGLVRPDHFIPIAESTGMIIEIGRWILQQACLQAKYWQQHGLPSFRIAVNISAVQFADKNLVNDVKEALEAAELDAKYLELELTESGIIEDMGQTIQVLNQLKQLGVDLAIDDFGTGYSSLSYLKQFPIDRIKIDKSFVQEVTESNNAQELTLAIISMAHSLGMKVIAEGIESEQQHEFLHSNKCEELQGFYFGRPVTEDKLSELIKQKPEI